MSTNNRGHGGELSEPDAAQPGAAARLRSWLPIVVGLAVVVGTGLWFGGLLPSRSGAERQGAAPATFAGAAPSNQQLPAFISAAAPRVQEAYTYAAAHGDELQQMPCYCGCGVHSGHRWVRDCFVKDWTASDIKFEAHGSGCDVCVSIALDVKNGLENGQSLAAVRKFIDGKYSKLGPGTNTPLPPG
jgi:Protein of unknown function with PCYCGC motif